MTRTSNYKDDLLKRLTNPEYAAGYLSDCAIEGHDAFLIGLRNVAEALGGLGQLATETELDRKGLYNMLDEGGNPRLSSLFTVLDAVGMQFQCVPTSKT